MHVHVHVDDLITFTGHVYQALKAICHFKTECGYLLVTQPAESAIASRNATVPGTILFQCCGCMYPLTHSLDPLDHSAYSCSNTTAVYFEWKARNSIC